MYRSIHEYAVVLLVSYLQPENLDCLMGGKTMYRKCTNAELLLRYLVFSFSTIKYLGLYYKNLSFYIIVAIFGNFVSSMSHTISVTKFEVIKS